MNREMKIWASESDEGWLLPSDADSWHCTQTLELDSSACPRVDEAFFNQVVALSQAGLLLLANAKKNAIYVVHLDYGPNPAATRMDYIAEFTVTMPILSFTGTSDILPHGEQIVQVYCVQTQAIQQYALDLSQCLPPPLEHGFEKSDSSVSRDVAGSEVFTSLETSGVKPTEISFATSAAKSSVLENSSENTPTSRQTSISASFEVGMSQEFATSSMESKPVSMPMVVNDNDVTSFASPPVPLSPRLSRKVSGLRSPSSNFEHGSQVNESGGDQKIIEYSVDRQMDTVQRNLSDIPSLDDDPRNNDEKKVAQDDITAVLNQPIKFRHPTHLVTPSEILRATSSSDTNHVSERKNEGEPNIQDVVVNNDAQNVEVEVKVVGETRITQNDEMGSEAEIHSLASEHIEKSFCSQISDLGIEMSRECCPLPAESYNVDESRPLDGASGIEAIDQSSSAQEEVVESAKDVSGKVVESVTTATHQPPASTKGKKQKGKTQGSAPSSPSPSVFNSTDSSNEPGVSSSVPSADSSFLQIQAMQDMLNQVIIYLIKCNVFLSYCYFCTTVFLQASSTVLIFMPGGWFVLYSITFLCGAGQLEFIFYIRLIPDLDQDLSVKFSLRV